jgi:hypothetical protein
MKDRRVLRGSVLAYNYEGPLHLIVDDGNFNDAWRITKFLVAPRDLSSSSAGSWDSYAVLATHAEALADPAITAIWWRWEDRRQVAWTSLSMFGDSSPDLGGFNLIDPQHVVVRDLYFGLTAGTATGTTEFNYFIELERVKLTDDQAVLAIVQEVAQDVN